MDDTLYNQGREAHQARAEEDRLSGGRGQDEENDMPEILPTVAEILEMSKDEDNHSPAFNSKEEEEQEKDLIDLHEHDNKEKESE